jgi:hypothetical protein
VDFKVSQKKVGDCNLKCDNKVFITTKLPQLKSHQLHLTVIIYNIKDCNTTVTVERRKLRFVQIPISSMQHDNNNILEATDKQKSNKHGADIQHNKLQKETSIIIQQ